MNARVRSTLSLLLAFTWGCAAQTGTNVRRDVEEMLRQAGDATVLQRGEVLVMRVDVR